MPLTICQATKFRRDVKRLKRQGIDLTQLQAVLMALVAEETLDERYRDHVLVGNWRGFRECHIQPDWLLIYRVENNELQLARTGSHARAFPKSA
ncbi:MAG: type II toxin-antitoxin system YafQ family toxin [Anaerolineae bacterium]|nr:type II toxin-antitoxin system YafQ family toxin [Anaerolineae bacterium]